MDELLAWYANGTLDEAERQEVEAWLENNPDAQLQLAEYEFMQQSVAELGDDEPVFNTEAGLDNLMTRIETEEAANEAVGQQSTSTMLERLQNWLDETLNWNRTPAFARVAMVSQFGLVLALGVVLLLPSETNEGYEVLSGTTPAVIAAGPTATIGFNVDTRLVELQQLLREQQVVIVGGPSAIGTYQIELPKDDLVEARLAALKAHPAVIYLQRNEP
ncbi:hypothetical protein DV711_02855 [Motiliproteus coralliicola]|uniref:Zinc-finger domain-containing protein n=2 Tax=Motiliproteus coralliicola TaxID=2283196 RepID=A0A369WVG8_9GAMM|nr:hypothetical protein DV711_02855 [Motiliproteus coralliicola]